MGGWVWVQSGVRCAEDLCAEVNAGVWVIDPTGPAWHLRTHPRPWVEQSGRWDDSCSSMQMLSRPLQTVSPLCQLLYANLAVQPHRLHFESDWTNRGSTGEWISGKVSSELYLGHLGSCLIKSNRYDYPGSTTLRKTSKKRRPGECLEMDCESLAFYTFLCRTFIPDHLASVSVEAQCTW